MKKQLQRIKTLEDMIYEMAGTRTVEMLFDENGKPLKVVERFYDTDGELLKENPSTFSELVKYDFFQAGAQDQAGPTT